MRKGLGDDYVETLFELYEGRVPPEADLVTYWFEARAQIKAGRTQCVGLVATNSIRGGANRRVLDESSKKVAFSRPGAMSLGSSTALRCVCQLFALETIT